MARRLAVPLLVALAALVAVWPATGGGFVYDDSPYLLLNPAVSGDGSWLTDPLGTPDLGLWRPLTVLSWRLQWGPAPSAGPFLLVNVLLHAATALLVLLLGRRLSLSPAAAALGALLFAVHPVHAEAVAWITGRAEVLAALLVVAAWCAHLDRRAAVAWCALPLLALAGLAKENALAAPALFVAADLLLPERRARLPWLRLTALGAVSVGVFALRFAVLESPLPTDGPYHDLALTSRAAIALKVLGQSVSLLAWPEPLRIHYDRGELLITRTDLLAVAGAFAASIVLLWARRRDAALALLLVPVALLPVLHLLPIGEPFAERFLYLPSVPFCLGAGALLAALGRGERASGRGLGASAVLTLALALGSLPVSRAATARFESDLTLWEHAARVHPESAVVHYNLASHLERSGRWLSLDDDRPGVAEALRTSLRLSPSHPFAGYAHQTLGHIALGAVGVDAPNPRSAARHYRRALELEPRLTDARLNLASLAVEAPELVTPAEARDLLVPLLGDDSLPPGQAAARDQLFVALSTAASSTGGSEASTSSGGRSSPDGS